MVAEDEAIIRLIIRTVLSRAGYWVLEAENGRRALEVADQHPGDIVLLVTDINMPELDGHQLARQLRARRPSVELMAVSAQDGGSFPPDIPYAAVMQKPFSIPALVAKVRELTGQA